MWNGGILLLWRAIVFIVFIITIIVKMIVTITVIVNIIVNTIVNINLIIVVNMIMSTSTIYYHCRHMIHDNWSVRSCLVYCDFPQPLPWPILFKLLTHSLCWEKVIIMIICIISIVMISIAIIIAIIINDGQDSMVTPLNDYCLDSFSLLGKGDHSTRNRVDQMKIL